MKILFLGLAVAGLMIGCSAKSDGDGKATVEVDVKGAKDSTKDALAKAGKEIEDGAAKAKDKLEDAGHAIADKFEETKEKLSKDDKPKIEIEVKKD